MLCAVTSSLSRFAPALISPSTIPLAAWNAYFAACTNVSSSHLAPIVCASELVFHDALQWPSSVWACVPFWVFLLLDLKNDDDESARA